MRMPAWMLEVVGKTQTSYGSSFLFCAVLFFPSYTSHSFLFLLLSSLHLFPFLQLSLCFILFLFCFLFLSLPLIFSPFPLCCFLSLFLTTLSFYLLFLSSVSISSSLPPPPFFPSLLFLTLSCDTHCCFCSTSLCVSVSDTECALCSVCVCARVCVWEP